MKTIKNQVAVEATIAERVWTAAFGSLMAAAAVCFPRRDLRMLGRAMRQGMLMELERRNCWTLAEALGHDGPHRLQHFLSRGVWNHDLARDRLAAWVTAELADDEAVLIADETGDEKSSTDCVGASHQYSGALGGVGLCQVAVHLTYASPRGHALIDRELYLPAAWAEGEERRLLRHVPDEVTFATKPQLAAAMLHRAQQLGLPARWFTGDEVYSSLELRRTARTLGFDYALAVRADHRASTAVDRFSATELAAKVPARAWMRRRTGNGTKGDRHYDWALIDVLADDAPVDRDEAGHAFLVVRRHRYTRELSFYRCHSTTPVSLAVLVNIICTRWKIEEDFQGAKGLAGLDQGQVTCWTSWMRWSLISLFAAAVLAVTHAATRTVDGTEHGLQLAPASGRELLTVLRITALPTPRRDLEHALHWSAWRRHHQHQATEAHRRWNNITAAATT
ncbi:IS701 family transposase [Streptomyces sp. NPDC086080]|uniref:IS701 family transposase n=1 Tax=Streptomyces sp. NPDC086080 TaxID=3365748 RepID=UPI0037CCDE49